MPWHRTTHLNIGQVFTLKMWPTFASRADMITSCLCCNAIHLIRSQPFAWPTPALGWRAALGDAWELTLYNKDGEPEARTCSRTVSG